MLEEGTTTRTSAAMAPLVPLHGKATIERECFSGCVREDPGTDDHCAAKKMECRFGDGSYCGSSNGVASYSAPQCG